MILYTEMHPSITIYMNAKYFRIKTMSPNVGNFEIHCSQICRDLLMEKGTYKMKHDRRNQKDNNNFCVKVQ